MDTSNNVPTFTEINRVCLRDGDAAILRVWYWQRHKDMDGKGWAYYTDFIDNVVELGLSEKRARQLLEKGLGKFWWKSGNVIRFMGLVKLDGQLDLSTNEGARVLIPVDAFLDLRTFSAYAYATWFARATQDQVYLDEHRRVHADGGKTISRETLRTLFGITKYTQRAYEEIAHMGVEQQVAIYKVDEGSNIENISLPENFLNGNRGGVWYFDVDGDGQHEVVRQIPNRISSELTVEGHRARIKTGGSPTYRRAEPNQFKRSYYYKDEVALKEMDHKQTRAGHAYVRTGLYLHLRQGMSFRAWKSYF